MCFLWEGFFCLNGRDTRVLCDPRSCGGCPERNNPPPEAGEGGREYPCKIVGDALGYTLQILVSGCSRRNATLFSLQGIC